MLWSLIKIILFMVAVAAAALGVEFLLGYEGGIQVTVGGLEYSFTPFFSVLGLLTLIFGVWLFLKLLSLLLATWHFMNGDETALSRYFDRNRERRGYDALAQGMMALASGEGRVALAKAEKASRYLGRPDLTNLLTAQAAELAGDTRKAEQTYRKLVENEKTRFVGVRGILKQRLASGDTATAMKLAEKAFVLKPRHEDTQDVLLTLQAQAEDWIGARETLNAKLKHGSLPRDVHKRRDAVLALTEAKDLLAAGKTDDAHSAAIAANKQSPDFIPAAVMAARAHIAQGKPKLATRVVKKSWEAQPHPELAAAFAEIEPKESADARIKRFSALTRAKPDHPENKMLLAELNIAAEDFPAARRALGDLVETDPTKRNLTLMAAIERGEGADDSVVKAWLAKAVTASAGPQWICDVDGKAYPHWVPVTEGGFDTLSWKTSTTPDMSDAAGTQMLPLIVGALEQPTDSGSETGVEVEGTLSDVPEEAGKTA